MVKYKKMELALKQQQDLIDEKLVEDFRNAKKIDNTYQNYADYPRPPGQTRASSVQDVNIVPKNIQNQLMSHNRSEAHSPQQDAEVVQNLN